jgi:Ni,Fe-hydrogenase I cytochrome b subunit
MNDQPPIDPFSFILLLCIMFVIHGTFQYRQQYKKRISASNTIRNSWRRDVFMRNLTSMLQISQKRKDYDLLWNKIDKIKLLVFDEHITKLLLVLDGINVYGNIDLKHLRKSLIDEIYADCEVSTSSTKRPSDQA